MILLLPWLPFLAAFAILFVPKEKEGVLKLLAIGSSAACFAITLFLFFTFDRTAAGYQFMHKFEWLPALGISYQVGLDGINLTLCLLHALVSLAGAFVACWPESYDSGTLGGTGHSPLRRPKERLKEYLFFYSILVGAIYGVFTSLDLFFLYLYYETTLIPLFPMIGVWGSKNKSYGAMKLTIFITAGAVLALFGILLLYRQLGTPTFDLIQIQQILRARPFDFEFQKTVAAFLLIGFGVIASLWPLHSWSPIGYAAAPTSVSMLHAGVLKKMGPYLILRLAIALLPAGTAAWAKPLAVLAGIGIVYAGYAALQQKDLKFMIGFSSVSHMGYVLLGIAALTHTSLSGAVLLIFSHGVMAAATFAVIGFLYEQTHTRGVSDFGGLGKKAPFIAVCFALVSFASLGLPGFSNFVSELLVFIGSWQKFPVITGFAVFGILVTALYLLRAVQKVCYGPENPTLQNFKDMSGFFQKFPLLLLLGALLIFGFWPQGLLNIIRPAVTALLATGLGQ